MKTNKRQPIVTVLGHVDHGKTSLLDAIRKTQVAEKEAGGITQSIGASQVTTKKGEKVTFIDTPGHAAFSKMRSRGADVADIALLVIAADDGVKPQTKEALKFIKEANIPYIVVATKSDLAPNSLQNLQSQLSKEGVALEKAGGDVPFVAVSAKKEKGIDELLDVIILLSEINEIRADSEGDLEAVVIETRKDKRGPTAALVVRNGSIRVGDDIFTQDEKTRVRSIYDDNEKPVGKISPGEPGLILGFSNPPPVGAKVTKDLSMKVKTEIDKRKGKPSEDGIPVVIKANTQGSLEAIEENLPEKVFVIASGVGDVTESDIFLAKSAMLSSIVGQVQVFSFDSKVPTDVRKMAETEGIKIYQFSIIYEFLQKLDELIKNKEPEVLGKAEILASFDYDNKKVAGCKVLKGVIRKDSRLILERKGEVYSQVGASSMKKEQGAITEAKSGEEFGVIFNPQVDFRIGDMISSVRIQNIGYRK